VANLKAHLKKLAPQTLCLFTEENYKQYFTRTIFTGAVTKVSKLVVDQWAVLLGDAAHSAFPATGEGINSALEDCSVLNNSLQTGANLGECLQNFEKNRLEDANALSDIAYGTVFQNFKSAFQMIFLNVFKRFFGPSKEDYLFGTISKDTKRYSEVVNIWKQQTAYIGGPNIPKPIINDPIK
jgi:2-polyprenyl-6-methoxyphenol hydroxylase-like FAD-dependent oxidoreductase